MPIYVLDNPAMTKALGENFRIVTTQYQMNPLVVVTRASQAGTELEQEEIKNSIANEFKIPAGSIYMYDNYTEEKEKTMKKDKKDTRYLGPNY